MGDESIAGCYTRIDRNGQTVLATDVQIGYRLSEREGGDEAEMR